MFPPLFKSGLQKGTIKNIIVIGHGTAAVAGVAVADALAHYLKDKNINITCQIGFRIERIFVER